MLKIVFVGFAALVWLKGVHVGRRLELELLLDSGALELSVLEQDHV